MGREIVYCSQCGVRILEKDLAAGRAFTVLDKVFCAECRDQAFTQGPGPAPAPAKTASPAAPERKATLATARAPGSSPGLRPPSRPEGIQPPRALVRKKTHPAVLIGSAVGVLAMVVVIVLILSSGDKKQTRGGAAGTGASSPEAAKLTPEERAAKRLNELHAFAASSSDPAAVVKKAAEAEKDIAGTPSEEAYRKFRRKWEGKIAEGEAVKKIDAWIAQAKTIATADTEFKRRPEALELLQKAEELALTDAVDKVADVKGARREIDEPYEAAADAWLEKNGAFIRTVMKESDYKGALKLIDRFPEPLKLSKTWRVNLSRMREDCEKGVAAQAAKAAGKEAEKDWKAHLRIADSDHQLKNYAKAKENYLKAEAGLPPEEKLIDTERRSIAWALFYNLGCLFAEESKKLEGANKAKAVDSAFEYLGKAGARGAFDYPCGCGNRDHKSGRDHWDTDKDLETIRSDPRYAEIIKKFAK